MIFMLLPIGGVDGDNPQRTQSNPEELNKPMYQSVIKKEGSSMVGMGMGMAMGMGAGLRSAAEAASLAEDYVSPPKYKSSLLHRYLNDSLRHVMVANAVMDARKRNHSGSFSSNEYDDELLSPSSSEAEANFVYRAGKEPHFLNSFPSRVSFTHTTSFTFVLFFLSPPSAHFVLIPAAGPLFPTVCLSPCLSIYYTAAAFSHCFLPSLYFQFVILVSTKVEMQ